MQTINFRDFPIFSLTSNGNDQIVLSGGGGSSHGIENFVECIEVDKRGKRLRTVTSDPLGLVDCIVYNNALNLYCGGLDHDCILFRFGKEKDSMRSLEICGRWKSVPVQTTKNKKIAAQDRCAVSPNAKVVATTAEDGIICFWDIEHDSTTGSCTSKILASIPEAHGSTGTVADMKFSPVDDQLLASAGAETVVFYRNCERVCSSPLQLTDGRNLAPRRIEWLSADRLLVIGAIGRTAITSTWRLDIDNESLKCIAYKEFKNVPMFNCVTTSQDKTFFAVASNADIWTCSTTTLNVMSCVRRGSQGFYYDLPTTGIAICNKNTRLVIGSADYTVAVLDIKPNGTILAKNDTFANKTKGATSDFINRRPMVALSVVVAAVAAFVPPLILQQTANIFGSLCNRLLP